MGRDPSRMVCHSPWSASIAPGVTRTPPAFALLRILAPGELHLLQPEHEITGGDREWVGVRHRGPVSMTAGHLKVLSKEAHRGLLLHEDCFAMMSAWPKTLDRDLLEEPFEHRRLVTLAW